MRKPKELPALPRGRGKQWKGLKTMRLWGEAEIDYEAHPGKNLFPEAPIFWRLMPDGTARSRRAWYYYKGHCWIQLDDLRRYRVNPTQFIYELAVANAPWYRDCEVAAMQALKAGGLLTGTMYDKLALFDQKVALRNIRRNACLKMHDIFDKE